MSVEGEREYEREGGREEVKGAGASSFKVTDPWSLGPARTHYSLGRNCISSGCDSHAVGKMSAQEALSHTCM